MFQSKVSGVLQHLCSTMDASPHIALVRSHALAVVAFMVLLQLSVPRLVLPNLRMTVC